MYEHRTDVCMLLATGSVGAVLHTGIVTGSLGGLELCIYTLPQGVAEIATEAETLNCREIIDQS